MGWILGFTFGVFFFFVLLLESYFVFCFSWLLVVVIMIHEYKNFERLYKHEMASSSKRHFLYRVELVTEHDSSPI